MPLKKTRKKANAAANILSSGQEIGIELTRFMPYRLSLLSLAISQSIAQIYSERFNIGIMEWRVIAVLGSYQPLSSSQICDHTNMDKVQVSRAVSSLSRSRMLLRKTDNQDRRRSHLRLSAKGMSVYRQVVPLALERERDLMAALNTEEQKLFDSLLLKLEQRAEALSPSRN